MSFKEQVNHQTSDFKNKVSVIMGDKQTSTQNLKELHIVLDETLIRVFQLTDK